jgi:hypothetical protein
LPEQTYYESTAKVLVPIAGDDDVEKTLRSQKYIFGNVKNKDITPAFLNEIVKEMEPSPLTNIHFIDPH